MAISTRIFKADRLFYVLDGELEVAELGKRLKRGPLIGEIGVFAPEHERTATILCHTDCHLLEISESTAKQLYFQDRSFGFAILKLIINRLLENNRRLMESAADRPAALTSSALWRTPALAPSRNDVSVPAIH